MVARWETGRRLDERYDPAPSTALIPGAGQYLGQISFLGTHARRSYVRRELHAAEAATLMGQLVWDASQPCSATDASANTH
jgi:hypothetical protein